MPRKISLFLVALASTVSIIDGFKFMSNWQPPKILTDSQKVEIAKTEERFGNKSESQRCDVMDGVAVSTWVDASRYHIWNEIICIRAILITFPIS